MKLEVAVLSDPGKVRPGNEDAYGSFAPAGGREQRETGWLFVVADGMGGHQGGEIASRLAVDAIHDSYFADPDSDRGAVLVRAVKDANGLVLEQSQADSSLSGMGTTCTAMAIHDGRGFFIHIGDSRAYLLREGELVQLTNDHSLVGEMIRSGMITDEDARNHPRRNVITRSLGVQEAVEADTPHTPFELRRDDLFLLCSDGLSACVSDEEIRGVLAGKDLDSVAGALVEMANARGGKDNVTVLLIRVRRV